MTLFSIEIDPFTASAFLLLLVYHLGLLVMKDCCPEATIYARNAKTRVA